MADGEAHALHRLVFSNDVDALTKAVQELSVSDLNRHYRGHTPLSLAICLNHKACVKVLLDHGASTLQKTSDGWSPFQEATSIGDREVMEEVFRHRRKELSVWFQNQGKEVLTSLSTVIGTSVRIDTTLVGFERLTWIRGDISIIFTETPEGPRLVICDRQRQIVQQVYPRDFTLSDKDVEEEISVSLNTDIWVLWKAVLADAFLSKIAPPEIDFQSLNVSRAQNGFWSFKVDRNEKVGAWDTQVWNVECLEFVNRVRTEHLNVEPLPAKVQREKLNAAKKEAPKPTSGFVVVNADEEEWASEAADTVKEPEGDDWTQAKRHFRELAAFRATLESPPVSSLSAEEFFKDGAQDEFVQIGRQRVQKSSTKAFKGTIWMYNGGQATPETPSSVLPSSVMGWISGAPSSGQSQGAGPPPIQSEAFPIQLSTLVPLLDLLGMSSNQHIRSLREFFNVQLPPGFPVKMEIPLNMIPLSAVITFQNIDTNREIDPSLFIIPGKKEGYREGEVVRGSTET
ncbi:GPCR-chaperone-domain-containing protein [Chytridium lagenaria]|nr:GPCR-chaperone-domain-containing protein [Chytridium lagenaria]